MARLDDDEILSLVGRIYDTALDPSIWPEVLKALVDALDGMGVNLFLMDGDPGRVIHGVSAGLPDDGIAAYNAYYVTIDPRVRYCAENPLVGSVYEHQFIDEDGMDRSEYYRWLAADELRYHISSRVEDGLGNSGRLAIQRTRRQGHVEPADIRLFEKFAPHVERAVQIGRRLGNLDLLQTAAADAVERLPYGVALLDAEGRVIFLNRIAGEIVDLRDGLTSEASGLRADRPATDAALWKLISGAIEASLGSGSGAGGVIPIDRPSGRRAYSLLVTPVSRNEKMFATIRPAAIVFVTDPERDTILPYQAVGRLHRLTPAEARLAVTIAAGKSLKEYADEARITIGTARWRLKQVMEKTDTHRQGELVRLLLSGPAGLGPSPADNV